MTQQNDPPAVPEDDPGPSRVEKAKDLIRRNRKIIVGTALVVAMAVIAAAVRAQYPGGDGDTDEPPAPAAPEAREERPAGGAPDVGPRSEDCSTPRPEVKVSGHRMRTNGKASEEAKEAYAEALREAGETGEAELGDGVTYRRESTRNRKED